MCQLCMYEMKLDFSTIICSEGFSDLLLQTKEAGKNLLKTISEKRLTASSSQANLPDDLPEAVRNASTVSAPHETPKTPLPSPNATPDNFSTPLFIRKTSKYKM